MQIGQGTERHIYLDRRNGKARQKMKSAEVTVEGLVEGWIGVQVRSEGVLSDG